MPAPSTCRLATGVPGLDHVLGGGLPAHRMYLVEGDPGAGKTTLAMQFLLEGARLGERGLYVTLSETQPELEAVAASHGWSLSPIEVFELGDTSAATPDEENTLYLPSEVELGERVRALLAEVQRVKPQRVVIDSCTELRLLAQSAMRFRRQLLALKENLVGRNSSILLIDNPRGAGDALLQSLVHGVIHLEQLAPMFGGQRRRLRVIKMRELAFRGGFHDVVIKRGGLQVFPRLVAAEHARTDTSELLPSGVDALDELMGGGLERGSSTLFMGPSGSAKSTLASRYAVEGARRGERAAFFVFDEALETLLSRAAGLGMPMRELHRRGVISMKQVDPAELSPGEFMHEVRMAVERDGARMVVIDSLNGFLHAMTQENLLVLQLHELLSYLRRRGVAALMVVTQHGFFGTEATPIDVSYLADNVIVLRFFEAAGRVRRALSVLKKRSGRHEDTIRELALGPDGIRVGPPLTQFRGILTGTPLFRDTSPDRLLRDRHDD